MRLPPNWLAPWLVPVALLIALGGVAISAWVGAVVLVAILGMIVYWRVQYLKEHPPDPELRRKNFWDLR